MAIGRNAKKSEVAATTTKKAAAWPKGVPTMGMRVDVDSTPYQLAEVPTDARGNVFSREKHRVEKLEDGTEYILLTPKRLCISINGRRSYGGIRSDIQKLHREIAKSQEFIAWMISVSRKGTTPTKEDLHKQVTAWLAKHRPDFTKKQVDDVIRHTELSALPKMRYNVLTDQNTRKWAANKHKITFPESKKGNEELWAQRVEEVGKAINFPAFVGISSYQSGGTGPTVDESTLDKLFG